MEPLDRLIWLSEIIRLDCDRNCKPIGQLIKRAFFLRHLAPLELGIDPPTIHDQQLDELLDDSRFADAARSVLPEVALSAMVPQAFELPVDAFPMVPVSGRTRPQTECAVDVSPGACGPEVRWRFVLGSPSPAPLDILELRRDASRHQANSAILSDFEPQGACSARVGNGEVPAAAGP